MAEKDKTQDLISDSIKKIAKEKGITLAEVANRMNAKGSTLHQAIYGNPTLETLERIATALQVDIRLLFEGTGTGINGLVQYKGRTYTIDSVESVKRLLSDIENA